MSNRAPFLFGIVETPNDQPEAEESEPASAEVLGGLGRGIYAHVYPLALEGLSFVLGMGPNAAPKGTLQFQPEGRVGFSLDYKRQRKSDDQSFQTFRFWNKYIKPTIWEPCVVRVTWRHWKKTEYIGSLHFRCVPAPPLSAEQQRRLQRTYPEQRVVTRTFDCSACRQQLSAYVSVSKLPPVALKDGREHWIWYQDLPKQFVCSCERLSVDLKYMRESMHHYLVEPTEDVPADENRPVVTLDTMAKTIALFEWLLAKEPSEEEVQVFLQDNSNLLRIAFGARHVFFKPPILNKYRADFGIVNVLGELTLIEIERPSLQLFRADGVRSAGLTEAIAQTEAWHDELTEYRAAALHGIEGCPDQVTNINYMVIAGRSAACEPEVLTRFIRSCRGDMKFMTFDHLIERIRAAFT